MPHPSDILEVPQIEAAKTGRNDRVEFSQPLTLDDELNQVDTTLDQDISYDREVALRDAEDEEEIDRIRATLGLITGDLSNPEQGEVAVDAYAESQLAAELSSIMESEGGDNSPLENQARNFAKRTIDNLTKALADGKIAGEEIKWVQELLAKIDNGTFTPEDLSAHTEFLPRGKVKKLKELGLAGLDFVPILGPVKMLLETYRGTTFSGQKLGGWKRAIHGLEGACFSILDSTGIGAVGSKAIKGSTLAMKMFSRSAAMGRRLGIAREIYMPMFKAGKAIERNPLLAKVANRAFSEIIHNRRSKGLI